VHIKDCLNKLCNFISSQSNTVNLKYRKIAIIDHTTLRILNSKFTENNKKQF